LGKRGRFVSGAGTPPELPLPAAARFGLETVAYAVGAVVVVFFGIIVVGSFTRVWGIDFTPTLTHYDVHSEPMPASTTASGCPPCGPA
jgi:iron(III) transport system permease protein